MKVPRVRTIGFLFAILCVCVVANSSRAIAQGAIAQGAIAQGAIAQGAMPKVRATKPRPG